MTMWWFLVAAGGGVAGAWWVSGSFADARMAQLIQSQSLRAQTEVGVLAGDVSQHMVQALSLPAILSQGHNVQEALAAMGPRVAPSTLAGPERRAQWLDMPVLVDISRQLDETVERFGLNTAWVTNAAGDAVAEGRAPGVPSFLGTNYADRDYFKAAQAGRTGSQFAVGRVTQLFSLYFAAPVLVNGQFVGMVGASARLDRLSARLDQAHLLVTDEHGVVVLAHNPAMNLQALPNAQVHQLTPEQRQKRYQRTDFATVGLHHLSGQGTTALYDMVEHMHPHVWATRVVMDGALQVHVLRDLGEAHELVHGDRLRWFALAGLAWLFLLGWLVAASAYVAVARQQRKDLLVLNDELQRQANTDVLTGGASRRHYLEMLHLEQDRAQRYGLSFCVLSLDIDHFKHVNDTFGHAAGDAVLRHFALVVQGLLRQSDLFGRVGGEEFSVLLPQSTVEGGRQMAQRIRAAVEASPTAWEDQSIAITVSIGGAQWLAGQLSTVDQVLAASDRALYQAKHQGRNRVVWAESLPETSARDPEAPTRVT